MALGSIPPWLQPQDFVGAARSGAGLGLQRRGQDIEQAQATDRLTLAYNQLQAQEDRAAEQAQQKMQIASMALEQRQALADQALAFKEAQLNNRANTDAMLAQFHQGELQNAADKLAAREAHLNEPLTVSEINGVKVLSGGGAMPHAISVPAASTLPEGPVSARDVLDAEGNKIPNFFAVPNATGHGLVTLRRPPDASVMTPRDAFRGLQVVSEYGSRYPMLTNAAPGLVETIVKGAGGAGSGRVTTQQQYDALKPGTVYVGADGKRYRKP